jgi:hypothetical protein
LVCESEATSWVCGIVATTTLLSVLAGLVPCKSAGDTNEEVASQYAQLVAEAVWAEAAVLLLIGPNACDSMKTTMALSRKKRMPSRDDHPINSL